MDRHKRFPSQADDAASPGSVQFLANHMIMGWILCSLNAPLIDQFPELETEAFGCPLRSAINWWLSWWR